jgi:hypothetical protein
VTDIVGCAAWPSLLLMWVGVFMSAQNLRSHVPRVNGRIRNSGGDNA